MKPKHLTDINEIKEVFKEEPDFELINVNIHQKEDDQGRPLVSFVFKYQNKTLSLHYEWASGSLKVYKKGEDKWEDLGGMPVPNNEIAFGSASVVSFVRCEMIHYIKAKCKPKPKGDLEKFVQMKEDIEECCNEIVKDLDKHSVSICGYGIFLDKCEIDIRYIDTFGCRYTKIVSFDNFFNNSRFDKYDFNF